jgi:hypothetical protein
MSDRIDSADVSRIANLEGQVSDLVKALRDETKDRKDAEKNLQAQFAALDSLLKDNNEVQGYVIKYLSRLDAQYTAKELVLQESIRDFNEFMKLPSKSSKYVAMWESAWAILSTTVPALRLMPEIEKLEKLAAIEMASAKAFMKTPELQAKIVTLTAKGNNIADVIARGNDIRGKLTKPDEETHVVTGPITLPIKDLIKESNDAHAKLDTNIDTLSAEFEARLHSILFKVPYKWDVKVPYQWKESLTDQAKRLLPQLSYFDDAKLESLGRYFLWLIVEQYAKRNVFIVRDWAGEEHDLEGLNDSQCEQIMEWFGLYSNWHDLPPGPMLSLTQVFTIWGVREKRSSVYPPR